MDEIERMQVPEPQALGQPIPAERDTQQTSRRPKRRQTKAKSRRRTSSPKRPRAVRRFPASTFEEALVLPQAIDRIAAGQAVRRLTLFDKLGKSPDSGPSRQLITNSGKYGLTKGSYSAEHLELTPEGRLAVSQEVSPREQQAARLKLAIENIPPFKALYERFKGNKLPAQVVLRDFLVDEGYTDDEVQECVDTFIVNAKFLGLLRTVSGAERLLSIEHVLEESPRTLTSDSQSTLSPLTSRSVSPSDELTDWAKICFYVTPIGDPGSEERQHSDLFLSAIVEPAISEFGLSVVRADQIGKPGMITAQVIEHAVRSRLVIADLSFHNPNVFYELSLRHACRLPTVQVIRASDPIPFDLDQFRTIRIDTSSIYTLVPKLEIYQAEISNQVRQVLTDPDAVDNPLSTFYPGLRVTLSSESGTWPPQRKEASDVDEPGHGNARASA